MADTIVGAKVALLAALSSGDGYGVELIARVRERTKGRVILHQGSVYPMLHDLETKGMVRSYKSEAPREHAGRPGRCYKLTAAGIREAMRNRDAVVELFSLDDQ